MVLFVETLKAVFNRVILCLRSRIGFSNYMSNNTQMRKTTIHKTLQFEFEPRRLYVITHDLPVNPEWQRLYADLCRKGLGKCDTSIDNVALAIPTLRSNSSPKCEGFVAPVCPHHGWCNGHVVIQMSFQPVSDKDL